MYFETLLVFMRRRSVNAFSNRFKEMVEINLRGLGPPSLCVFLFLNFIVFLFNIAMRHDIADARKMELFVMMREMKDVSTGAQEVGCGGGGTCHHK